MFVLVRVSLVGLLAALTGFSAWLALRDDPNVYERRLSFVLRPSDNLTDGQIPDAVRGLSQQDAQLVNTIAGVLGSERLLRRATPFDVIAPESFDVASSVRPGSDLIDVRLTGPDPRALGRVTRSYRSVASDWIGAVYRAYVLEFLDEEAAPGPVAPRTSQLVGLATLLGALLGSGLVFLEWKARSRRTRVPSTATGEELLLAVEHAPERASRLERAIRLHLENGEDIVRVAPGRLRVVRRVAGLERTHGSDRP